MIDIETLVRAGTYDDDHPVGTADALADFCEALAKQLSAKSVEKTAKRNKGHVEYGRHIGTAVLELTTVAAGLRRWANDAGPVLRAICTAVNQDGTTCARTDAGHQAHIYTPADPADRTIAAAVSGEVLDGPHGTIIPTAVCGIQDRYAGETPDRCTRPPHGRDTGHEGAYSKWPWQDGPPSSSEPSDSQAILAFLKGDTDDLALAAPPRTDMDEMGTEAMVFPVEPPSAVNGDPMTPGMPDPCQPIGCDNGYHLPGCVFASGAVPASDMYGALTAQMQPDPFDNALPEEVRRTATWRPEPDPRPLWLPAPGYSTDRGSAIPAPTSIRTTHVRVGEECGMAYRLLSRDGVPEVPAWWNVGGNTLHECARGIELSILGGDSPHTLDDDTARALWSIKFREQIAALEAETPFPMHQWRAANKGAEGRDWWNEVGPLMVRDYSAASAQWHADGWDILPIREGYLDRPAMELEMHSPLMGMAPGGELTGHLDQAWYRLDEGDEWEIRIRDLKTGRELPTDEWQLEAYTLLLRSMLANSGQPLTGGLLRCRFSAVYYDARNGKDGEVKDLTVQNVAEIHYRAGSVLSMHANNSYPANPGSDWKAPCYLCSVRYTCPIMALKS